MGDQTTLDHQPTAVLTAGPEHPHASDYIERFQEAGRILCCYTGTISAMMYVSRLVLLLGLLLCVGVQLSTTQHWSHGWYPGGKRELESFTTSEVSEEIKLCEAGECSYLRPQHRSTLRSFFLDVLARELQKRK